MAGRSSNHVFQQVRRLFNVVRLERCRMRSYSNGSYPSRDESAEAAFEELMIRHGPMVFGICNSVLSDAHDAQDAFQAVFLVLANRASSIRRKIGCKLVIRRGATGCSTGEKPSGTPAIDRSRGRGAGFRVLRPARA